jgi:hypothetical protein
VLAPLSRGGTLCLPLSGAPGTTAQQVAAAIALCAQRGLDGSSVAWLSDTGGSRPAPQAAGPLPLAVPAARPASVSIDALAMQIEQALAGAPRPSP